MINYIFKAISGIKEFWRNPKEWNEKRELKLYLAKYNSLVRCLTKEFCAKYRLERAEGHNTFWIADNTDDTVIITEYSQTEIMKKYFALQKEYISRGLISHGFTSNDNIAV